MVIINPMQYLSFPKQLLVLLVFLGATAIWSDSLHAQAKQEVKPLPPGYPDRSANLDVLPGFKNPPAGYGEVSFYWWLGDTLTKERITWQLDQLAGRSITGLQINYAHSDEGGNIWGLTYPGKPGLFTKEWWDLFAWFLQEAKKRNMSVSLSDYTLGIAGQGWFVDDMLRENPGLHGSNLKQASWDIRSGLDTVVTAPGNVLVLTEYRTDKGSVVPASGKPLSAGAGGTIRLQASGFSRKLVAVYAETVKTSFDPMNPLSGTKVIEKFFQPFEEHCPGEAGKGLNFFFSDELNFGITGLLWNNRFAAEFRKRKGYDIVPRLSELFVDAGSETPKIRIDYNDVLVALSEESFFIPVYNWHTERGMLFGCDHGGRGLDVTEFGDYFRAQRWMSGPGCDQPVLDRHINKNKVASSIAHLYERPRTWLEGYHSSGWGTSSAQIADATFANFAMGQNLLSLHGLYYSTHGGWWEWAPPDNHFRQPYWAGMADFLKCSERLSYLLSQGHHRCDVAILYPVTPMVAGMGGQEAVAAAFAAGDKLYRSGIDYDFIDFESLARAKCKDGELQVSGERYKVLILPVMSAIRFSSLEKAAAFYAAGGVVIAIGALPAASDRIGRDDEELQALNRKIFGLTADETTGVVRKSGSTGNRKGTGLFLSKPDNVAVEVSALIEPDFRVVNGGGNPMILHRKAGVRDIYYVYGVPKDTACQFRCTGKVELWDPWTGKASPLTAEYSGMAGTRIRMPLGETQPQIIVFSPGEALVDADPVRAVAKSEMVLVGEWEFEIKPTLDNSWGDYRQPAYNGYTATDAAVIRHRMETSADPGWQATAFDDSRWDTVQVSYGPQFWKLGPMPGGTDSLKLESLLAPLGKVDPAVPVTIGGKNYYWKPYEFSWRTGLKDNTGRQGYHGLKEWIHDDILQNGKAVRDWPGIPSPRIVASGEGSTTYFWTTVRSAGQTEAAVVQGGLVPSGIWLGGKPLAAGTKTATLANGATPLLIRYSSPGAGSLVFLKNVSSPPVTQPAPLASTWFANPAVLPFDLMAGSPGQAGWYRFKTPPGLQSIELASWSKPNVWINGRDVPVNPVEPMKGLIADTLIPVWKAAPWSAVPGPATVAVRIVSKPGLYGGAAIPEPIRINCGKGMIRPGNLAENEPLRNYSGGMWYRKTLLLTAEQAGSNSVTLDLGDLVSSAEVTVNGKSAGRLLCPPWKFDVGSLLKPGENRLEILIYNTLGNYYQTVPSLYVGKTKSGLIGPVKLFFF
jgi:hypothetical protein